MATYKHDRKYKNNVEFSTSSAVKHLFWDDADGLALQTGDVVELGMLPPDTIVNSFLVMVDTAFDGTAPKFDIIGTSNGTTTFSMSSVLCGTAGLINLGNLGTGVMNPDGTTYAGDQSLLINLPETIKYKIIWKGTGTLTQGALRVLISYSHLEQTAEGFGLAYQPLNLYTGV